MNRLQSEVSHESHCDDELTKASVKKEDLEHQVPAHSFKLETAVSKTNVADCEVAELRAHLGDVSQQQKTNAMCVDELERVVNPMMTTVCQAAGSGDDMPGGMPGGGFDDATGAGGNGHDAVLVRGSTRSPIVQETIEDLYTGKAVASTCREKDGKTEKRTRKNRPRHRVKERRNEEVREEEKRTGEGEKNKV